jgi:hypothetical protein
MRRRGGGGSNRSCDGARRRSKVKNDFVESECLGIISYPHIISSSDMICVMDVPWKFVCRVGDLKYPLTVRPGAGM